MKWCPSLLVSATVLVGAWTSAMAAPYQNISPPQPTSDPGKVEVVELFWYGCPHCYRLQPHLERWLEHKPDAAQFVRMPAVLNESWAFHARAFFAAQLLGMSDATHRRFFDAIHAENRRKLLKDYQAVEDFFADQEIAREKFSKAWRSFAVDTKVRKARLMTHRYGIDGTPAIVVNGKYRTSASIAGSIADMLETVDGLIEQEAVAMEKKPTE